MIHVEDQMVEARQFSKSAGYPEDPATGIAAAVLSFGLLDHEVLSIGTIGPFVVRQGWSLGKPAGGQCRGMLDSGKVRQPVTGHTDAE